MAFRSRISTDEIGNWAERYEEDDDGVLRIVPTAKGRGFLAKDEFLAVCRWKTARSQSRCRSNSDGFIREVTTCAFGTRDERMRVEVLTLLTGVGWPTASVLLHFFHSEEYPILDFRALWSLHTDVPKQYDFEFWWEYTGFCRELSKGSGVSMRTLDRALWQFSKEKQP